MKMDAPARSGPRVPYHRLNRFATAVAIPALAAVFFMAIHHGQRVPLTAMKQSVARPLTMVPISNGSRATVRSSITPQRIAVKIPDAQSVVRPAENSTHNAPTGDAPTGDAVPNGEPVSVHPAVARPAPAPAVDLTAKPTVELAADVRAPLMSWQPAKVHLAADTGPQPTGPAQPDATPVVVPDPIPVADDNQSDVPAAGDTRPVSLGHVVDDFRASVIDDSTDDTTDQTAG
jgi:hypothetical protein